MPTEDIHYTISDKMYLRETRSRHYKVYADIHVFAGVLSSAGCFSPSTCLRIKPTSVYHNNYDSTTIRLRYDDATTQSTTAEVIETTICIRFDCDTTTTRLRRNIDMLIFCSLRVKAGARDTSQSDRSRIAVESQL